MIRVSLCLGWLGLACAAGYGAAMAQDAAVTASNITTPIEASANAPIQTLASVPTQAPADAPAQASVIDLTPPTTVLFISDGGVGAPRADWTVTPSPVSEQPLDYDSFIREVLQANLDYAAQRYNVDIAKAQLGAARLLPNPTIALDGNRDLTYHNKYATGSNGEPALLRQVESRSVGITETLQLGGKRKWRVRVADETYRAAAATVDDFFRNLKIDASEAFADALATQRTVDSLRIAATYLAELTQAQETRFHDGDIGEADLIQTRLDELQFRNDLSKAEDDAEQARVALSTFLGHNRGQTRFIVKGHLEQSARSYDLGALISQALVNRPDLVALRHSRDAAQSSLMLAKRQIIPDVDVGVQYAYNGGVTLNNPIDPTPAFHQLDLTLSIPVPLFDRGQYGVSAARAQADQAQVQLEAAEMKAEVAIRTADEQYRSAFTRVQSFKSDILKSTQILLDARRYSYEHGGSTLLELLDAQRSANDIQQAYQDALADLAKALLELQRATSVGEVSF